MLASATQTVALPCETVRASLLNRAWSVRSDGDAGHLLPQVGIKVGTIEVYKHVRLHVGVSFEGTCGDSRTDQLSGGFRIQVPREVCD